MKTRPFDLEAAKAGAKLVTRSGKLARIICYDRKNKEYPIIALIEDGQKEYPAFSTNDGCYYEDKGESDYDLFILDEPKVIPYESAEDFIKAQREHGWYIKMDGGYSPACDDTDDDDMYYVAPTEIASNIIIFAIIDDSDKHDDLISIHYADLVNYQWADGTPCGKLEE